MCHFSTEAIKYIMPCVLCAANFTFLFKQLLAKPVGYISGKLETKPLSINRVRLKLSWSI